MRFLFIHWRYLSLLLICFLISVDSTNVKAGENKEDCSDDLEGSETQSYFTDLWNYVKMPAVFYLKPLMDVNIFGSGPANIPKQRPPPPMRRQQPTYIQPKPRNPFNVSDCGDNMSIISRCRPSRYRTIDGSCTNPYYPTWGKSDTRYDRLIKPIYADGLMAPTVSRSGNPLPPARLVSFTLFPESVADDPKFTLATMQYGQIITHDMGMIRGSTQTTPHSTCCTDEGKLILRDLDDPTCFPMEIPADDPVYNDAGFECLNLVRSDTDRNENCRMNFGYAEQLNAVTSYLDLSIIYGSTDDVAAATRARIKGRLRVEVRNNREWLPHSQNATAACDVRSNNDVCYMAGDARVNQNPQLTAFHLLFWREHNRIAGELAKLNPHWSDETIYQESRRINIAQHQNIAYYEWLPILIGWKNALDFGIIFNTTNYVDEFDPSINPGTINEHSTAAFRYFHTNIQGFLNLVPESRCPGYGLSCPFLRLSDHFNKPAVLEQQNNFDDLTRGMGSQRQENTDQFFTLEITQFLFKHLKELGTDLRATDIQRNRDHGLASYNDFRDYCGLPKAHTWTDFMDYISLENIAKLKDLYETVDDVDLTVGGSLERHIQGTLSGPTFLCILIKQFRKTRVADRYWFETPDPEVGFTIEQLFEIRKASISRILCDNGNDIQSMQRRGFRAISERNPLMRCEDLPEVNLNYWKDYRD